MSGDDRNHWNAFYERWKTLPPPLRPHADVVRVIRENLPNIDGPVLLLGVTPELADIAPEVLAVDRSEMMIAKVWPGNTLSRRALREDWLSMELTPQHFSAAVGDGSFNAVSYPDGHERLYHQLRRFVRPGGRIIFRVYLRPQPGEAIDQLAAAAWMPATGSFHAYKWRLIMASAAERGEANVSVARISELFDRLFPDRTRLAAASGWREADIASIDVYRNSTETYSFPTEAQFRDVVPRALGSVSLVPTGNYELAERCPIAVLEIPS